MKTDVKKDNGIEELRERVGETLANLQFGNLLELDSELHQINSEEAIKLSIMMWNTVIEMAEQRRLSKSKMLTSGEETPREAFYSMPEMPYGKGLEYQVPVESIGGEILSLPYGDPEFIFEWSKILDQSGRDKSRTHPRVVIVVAGNKVCEVSSDFPVEYLVLRDLG